MKTFPSPVTTAEFSRFAGLLSAALSQHHLSGFEIAYVFSFSPVVFYLFIYFFAQSTALGPADRHSSLQALYSVSFSEAHNIHNFTVNGWFKKSFCFACQSYINKEFLVFF